MKTRSSLSKANWSETREAYYHKDCDELLFDRKLEIAIIGIEVYLKPEGGEKLLLQIRKPKAMWYETWFRLKYG
jgi:hypothetical protein